MHSFISMSEDSKPILDLDGENIYNELNIDVLYSINHRIPSYASKKENTLIIVDDYASQIKDNNLL